MEILIIFASQEGQTAKVAEAIAKLLRGQGHNVELAGGKRMESKLSPEVYDGVIIGASVHMGKYPGYIRRIVRQHKAILNQKPAAFFSVCMAANSKLEETRQQADRYIKDFLQQTGWKPVLQQSFAGAIRYSQYGFVTRWIMKRIAEKEGSDTDTSRDHEYTDWNAVSQFAMGFLKYCNDQLRSTTT